MKLERTKNAARNVVFDGTMEIVNVLFPFVIRSVMLHVLGTEYLGLNGLFKSILNFLNLAELGVGSAMVFSMYKPIAEDDTQTICALLRLYRLIYRIILIRNFRRDLRLGISVILRSLFGTSIHLRRICFMVQGVYRTFSCQNREILLLCIRIDNKTVEGIFRAVAIRVIRICAVLNIVISA